MRNVSAIPAWVYVAAILLGLAVTLTTVCSSPAQWLDSVMIAEIARPLLSGGDWGMNLLPGTDACDGPWAYPWVGSAIVEIAYRLFGADGPRLAGVAGLIAIVAVAWRLVGPLAAFTVFTFPPLVQSVRYGRVDVFTLLFVLLGMLAGAAHVRRRAAAFLAGMCGAVAFMSWVTALSALPVLAWTVLRNGKPGQEKKDIAWLTAGFVGCVGLMAIPIAGKVAVVSKRLLSTLVYAFAGHGDAVDGWMSNLQMFFGEMASACGLPALVALAVVWGVCRGKGGKGAYWLLAGMLLFLVVTLVRGTYVFRTVYFIPYMTAAFMLLRTDGSLTTKASRHVVLALAVLAAMNGIRTMGIWNLHAWRTRAWRDQSTLRRTMEEAIGHGQSVYADTYHTYYIGRDLDWRQYRIAHAGGYDAVGKVLARSDVDIYLGHGLRPDPEMEAVLQKAGYVFDKTIMADDPVRDGGVMHWWQFGPYNIWRKKR